MTATDDEGNADRDRDRDRDRQYSIRRYARHAPHYDASAQRTMPLRRRTIALLGLNPGQVVLDVGAGTGLSYELLLAGVGEAGRVLAFEQSPDMFAHAEARVRARGWGNVWHVNQPAQTVQLPEPADAVLFNYVHDIVRNPAAVANVMRQVKHGARVAIAGIKYFPWWTGPLNLYTFFKNRPYNAHPGGLWRPWEIVASYCEGFAWESTQFGMGYIGHGVRRAVVPAG
jgi:arsenite methyltransferase